MEYLKVKVSFPSSMFKSRGLVKLVILSGEDLDISSWWSSLAEKLSVSGRVYFMADIATDTKRSISPNTFGIPFSLFSLY